MSLITGLRNLWKLIAGEYKLVYGILVRDKWDLTDLEVTDGKQGLGVGKIELVEIVVYACPLGAKIRNTSSWKKWNTCWLTWLKFSVCLCLCVCVFFRRLYSYSHVEIPAPAIVMTFLTFPSDINLATPSRLTVDRTCLGGGLSPSALAMYSRRNSSPTRAHKGWGSISLHISASVLVLKLQRIYHDLDHFQTIYSNTPCPLT